jgi:large subunit ribosomal protein L4
MAQVKLYKRDGSENGTVELPAGLFDVKVKPDVIHQAIVTQEANARVLLSTTKDRSQVRGGGRKPWKQKGTGRARHGSRRSPIWSGGGVTFGPTLERVFGKKINKKVRRAALAMMLTDKVASDWLVAVEDMAIPEAKTKFIVEMRKNLPGTGRSALIVTAKDESSIVRAASNLLKTQTIGAKSLNVRDLAKYEYLIASKDALEEIKETYLS